MDKIERHQELRRVFCPETFRNVFYESALHFELLAGTGLSIFQKINRGKLSSEYAQKLYKNRATLHGCWGGTHYIGNQPSRRLV
jgi:hypothetical protein